MDGNSSSAPVQEYLNIYFDWMIEIVVSSIHPWRCDLAWLFWVQVCRLLNRANWFNSFVDGISIESLARSSSSSSRLIINRLFLFRLQVAAISAPRTAFNLICRARALLLSSASPPPHYTSCDDLFIDARLRCCISLRLADGNQRQPPDIMLIEWIAFPNTY